MGDLTIVAHIHAQSGQEDFVRTELEKLIDTTRAEPGCVRYDLHTDNDDPSHFMFYETWSSRELWQSHMGAPHVQAWSKATDGRLKLFQLHEMTIVSVQKL